LSLSRKKIIIEKDFPIEEIIIKKIELREYNLNNIHGEGNLHIVIYVNTNYGEIELDYLGKPTKEREKFDECYNFICNYNGLLSLLNRAIIEIKNDVN